MTAARRHVCGGGPTSLIPDAQLYIDPDAGHSPHTEQPGLDRIQRFLRR